MDLVLTVTGAPKEANMIGHTKTFTKDGGLLGRSADNDWMLPDLDRVVSSMHAKITYENVDFKIIDMSTNGTYVNDASKAIGNQNPHILNKGDTLIIGEYRLSVDIINTDPGLPSGLESVDFLDQTDKTQFTNVNTEAKNKTDDDFDSWLSPPQSQSSPQITSPLSEQDSWGTATTALAHNSTQSSPPHSQPDFLVTPAATAPSTYNNQLNKPIASQTDFLATPTATLKPYENDDEDWWSNEKEHGDPMLQSVQIPSQQSPHPSFATSDNNHAATHTRPSPPPIANTTTPQITPSSFEVPPQVEQFKQPTITHPHSAASNQIPSAPLGHIPQGFTRSDSTQTPLSTGTNQLPTSNLSTQLARDLGLSSLSDEQLTNLSPELALIVKETLNRLIDLLRARSSIKNELRIDRTMIETHNNNPLKFSVAADDALSTMFNSQNQSFMSPHQAISDGFDDISDHQVAVMSGMKAAYEAMLEQLSPERMQAIGNKQIKSGLLSNKKAQLWEVYQERFQKLRTDNEQCYRQLFGDYFSSAYEKQLAELKSTRSLTRK